MIYTNRLKQQALRNALVGVQRVGECVAGVVKAPIYAAAIVQVIFKPLKRIR